MKSNPFDDDSSKTDDFGAMLDASFGAGGGRLSVGDKIRGEILSIGKEQAFVSTGTPTDGQIPRLELLNDKKELAYKVGDVIDVVVLKVREGEIRLRLKGAKGAADDVENLEDAFDMELPVEGKVLEAVKGGYRVSIQGVKAFCPISQIDLRPAADPNVYVGNKYEFVITQYEAKGRNVVVSRRRMLEAGKAEAEGAFLQSNQVGDVVDGTVQRMEQFGAFVELLPGVEGLVHISEISWARLAHPSEVLAVGTPVKVKILKMEDGAGGGGQLRISLSIKQGGGESDPWMQLATKFPLGTQVDGTVVKKEAFGLFVSVAPGIQGLLPRSKWRDSAEAQTYENKKKGDPIKVAISEIRTDERKLTLGLPGEESDDAWRAHQAPAAKPGGGMGTMADLFKNMDLSSSKPTKSGR